MRNVKCIPREPRGKVCKISSARISKRLIIATASLFSIWQKSPVRWRLETHVAKRGTAFCRFFGIFDLTGNTHTRAGESVETLYINTGTRTALKLKRTETVCFCIALHEVCETRSGLVFHSIWYFKNGATLTQHALCSVYKKV